MIYKIGSCEVDADRFEIRRSGEGVPVEPQVFDLLLLLIKHRDRVVTRDEIIETVWKGRIVSEAAIASRIKAARRVIGDDGATQSMIRTIRRRGVRFVGEVVIDDRSVATRTILPGRSAPGDAPTETAPAAGPPPESHGSQPTEESAQGLDLSLPKRPSIVALPFQMLSGDADRQIIADGLSLDIMTRLARTRWLFVISRGTAFLFRGASPDARSIARKLGVRYVLQGTIHLTDRRIRIHAALIDAVADCEAWAEHFDGSIDEIFRIQDEIAGDIVSAVETEIEQSERRRALLTNPSSLDAWSAYHRGAWHMYQFTPEGYEVAERLFKLAAKLDPNAPRVFAGLSFVHWQRAFLEIGGDREGEIQQAFDYARHALLLDPREPQAYWALGRASLLRHDVDQAVVEIARSVELHPNFAMGHYSVAFARMLAADSATSELDVRQARRLSPYDLMSFAMLAVEAINATVQGRLDEGAKLADRAVRQPNSHYQILAIAAFCNSLAGRDDAARAYLARLKAIHAGYRIADYLRAFPYRDPKLQQLFRSTFQKLGLGA
jgi:TolB-like protein/DNA-binding winged helix-turn-helix (wHTH) protein